MGYTILGFLCALVLIGCSPKPELIQSSPAPNLEQESPEEESIKLENIPSTPQEEIIQLQ